MTDREAWSRATAHLVPAGDKLWARDVAKLRTGRPSATSGRRGSTATGLRASSRAATAGLVRVDTVAGPVLASQAVVDCGGATVRVTASCDDCRWELLPVALVPTDSPDGMLDWAIPQFSAHVGRTGHQAGVTVAGVESGKETVIRTARRKVR